MKLVLFRDNLKNGLVVAEKAVANFTHLPILKNVLIKTMQNKIHLITTNLECAVTKAISGKIIEEGSITVPFSTLYNIVVNTPHDRIHLDDEQGVIMFKTDNYEAKIQATSAEEFPLIPQIENKNHSLEIDPVIFLNALGQVVTAAHVSEIRPEISGVLFDFQLTMLKLVATDSFRLAEKIIPANHFKHTIQTSFKAILPLAAAHELPRIIGKDTPLTIFFDTNQILFKSGDVEFISRLIDGTYPDYEQIIPKDAETDISFDRTHCVNAIKLVSNFSGKTNDVRIAANQEQKVLSIHSLNQFLGENKYLIPARVTGAPCSDIPFNWRYFLDGLKAISEESVVFRVNGSGKPALLKPADDTSYVYIIMPIRL